MATTLGIINLLSTSKMVCTLKAMTWVTEIPSVISDSGRIFKTGALGSDFAVFLMRYFAVDRKDKKLQI